MFLSIVMLFVGVPALFKGSIQITKNRKVKGGIGRILGLVLIIGAATLFLADMDIVFAVVILLLVCLIGFVGSEKVDTVQ